VSIAYVPGAGMGRKPLLNIPSMALEQGDMAPLCLTSLISIFGRSAPIGLNGKLEDESTLALRATDEMILSENMTLSDMLPARTAIPEKWPGLK